VSSALINLVSVQFKEIFRQPEIIFWAFIFPLAMAGILGLAFLNQEEPVRTVAFTGNIPDSLFEAIPALQNNLKTPLKLIKTTREEAIVMLQRGEINVFVEKDGDDHYQFNFDPSNADAKFTYLVLENKFKGAAKSPELSVKPITTKGSRYIDFLIPGLIALGIMNTCMWGVGWNLIEFRIRKLLRRMVATPLPKYTFLFSHLLTRSIIGLTEATLVFTFAHFAFGVVIKGSLIALLLLFLSGIFAFWGLAVFTSSRAENMAAGNGIINAVVLPMTMLSGVFFSYQGFPEWIVKLIKMLPLTILTDHIRAIFNEGEGISSIGLPVFILLLIGLVSFVLGARIYKWY
jgi:ABC-2 type transport system permease protein